MSFYHSLKLLKFFFPLKLDKIQTEFPKFSKAKEFFYYYHFPFLIHLPLIIVLSPYFIYHLMEHLLTIKLFLFAYIMPLLIYGFFIIYSVFFDKLQFYSVSPTLNYQNQYFTLKSSIVVTANLIFFYIHPLVGWLCLLFSIFYSYFVSIYLWSIHFNKRFLRTFSESLLLICIFLLILMIILFINNLLQSYIMLKRFDIL
jgi:hypothetical protein